MADAPALGAGVLDVGVQVPSPALEKLAGLAQLVEHLICNQRVACSSHVAGIKMVRWSRG